MPAPVRMRQVVYILVPSNPRVPGGLDRQSVQLGLVACRTAYQRGLVPIFPWAYYKPFMTEEEIDKILPLESLRWIKRASRIWVCWSQADWTSIPLDPLSHQILLDNEGLFTGLRRHDDPSRVPVYQLSLGGDGAPVVNVLERIDIASLLRCNIVDGMLRGAEM